MRVISNSFVYLLLSFQLSHHDYFHPHRGDRQLHFLGIHQQATLNYYPRAHLHNLLEAVEDQAHSLHHLFVASWEQMRSGNLNFLPFLHLDYLPLQLSSSLSCFYCLFLFLQMNH